MTPATIVIWLSLLASITYTFAVLCLKGATKWKVDPWRVAFICNTITALTFLPLLLLGGTIPSMALLWQPMVVGTLFLAGQVFTILALTIGDVSIATPMLGLKILLVAGLTFVLSGEQIGAELWAAATLATVAVALLGGSGRGGAHNRIALTAIFSVAAASCLASFDVLVQLWSPAWGAGRFMPLMIAMAAILSLLLIPRFEAPLRSIDPDARKWIFAGGILIGIQSTIFTTTIAIWGHAPLANVIYSSRGLWSVVLVWAIGHRFYATEQHLGRRVLATRLLGATLLSVAIFLVV